MNVRITKKYFLYLYKHRRLAARAVSKSVFLAYNKINDADIFSKLVFHIFFGKLNNKLTCPVILKRLIERKKIVRIIRKRFFKKSDYCVLIENLPTNLQNKKLCSLDYTQNELKSILHFLLIVEIYIHQLYLEDTEFIFLLINNINLETKIEILELNFKISPILCLVLLSFDEGECLTNNYKMFYYFLKSVNMDYKSGIEFLTVRNINFYKLEKLLLFSKYKIINEYHKIFINFYPEIIYNSKLSMNRLDYFNNPLKMPLDYKTIRSYIFCVPYFLKIENMKLNYPNFDVLYRVIYIEKILKQGLTKKWCLLIHILILDNCNIVYVLLKRKFQNVNIPKIAKHVPSFHLAFDHCIKFYKESKDEFYLEIIECLLKQYPVKAYYKKILNCKFLFSEEFCKRHKVYLDCLSN